MRRRPDIFPSEGVGAADSARLSSSETGTVIQSTAIERKRFIKVLLLPEKGMHRMECKFLCSFLDRQFGKVRSEFHHVAVGRRRNKDDRTAIPSLDFVGMMHHDAASWCGDGCGLARIQRALRGARHAPDSAGAKQCRQCLKQACFCFGWHQASAELMCRRRVSIARLNVHLEPGTSGLTVCARFQRAVEGAKQGDC